MQKLASTLAEEPDVVFAYLYGSFLEGRPFRDVDVGVYLATDGEEDAADLVSRAVEIADRLTEEVRLPVDVRPLNAAPSTFAFHVLRGRRLLSRDDELLAGLMADTARRYLDIEPLLRRATKEAFGR